MLLPILLLSIATGATPPPASSPEPWWQLAFEQNDWQRAASLVEEQGEASTPTLLRVLRLEASAAQLPAPNAGIPPEPKIRAGVLANHWEAWALSAAFDGAARPSWAAALDRAIELSKQAYTARQLPRIEATRTFLLETLAATGALEQVLDGESIPEAKVTTGGMLPSAITDRVVLLAGTHRFKDTVTVLGDAELWIQRGASLVPSGEDARILVFGALRIFGAGDERVDFGGSKSWLGLEYESDLQHVLTNARVRGARKGIEVRGSRLHLLDSVIEECGYGIYADSYNIWLESVRVSGCSEAAFRQRRHDGDSFFRDCSVRANDVGILLQEGGVLRVWSTEFDRNAVPVRALSKHASLSVRGSNFLGKGALELHPERAIDLRENYWGSKAPNFGRKIQYAGDAKTGNALLAPALKQAVTAGVRELD